MCVAERIAIAFAFDEILGRLATLRFLLATRRDASIFRRWVRRSGADVVHYWHQSGLSSALPTRGAMMFGRRHARAEDFLHDAVPGFYLIVEKDEEADK